MKTVNGLIHLLKSDIHLSLSALEQIKRDTVQK